MPRALSLASLPVVPWLLLLATVPIARAADAAASSESPSALTNESEKAARSPGTETVVYFATRRPWLVQMEVAIDKEPYDQLWRDLVERLFADLDRDRNDRVDAEELKHATDSPYFFAAPARIGKWNEESAALAAREPQGVDTVGFYAFFAERLAPYFSFDESGGPSAADRALFELLDVDHDQRITADELKRAATSLAARDFDDNGIVIKNELLTAEGSAPQTNAAGASASATPAATRRAAPFRPVHVSQIDPELAAALLAHYDRDQDSKLRLAGDKPEEAATAEIDLPKSVAQRLDANGDGALETDELARFADCAADVELRFWLGRRTVVLAEDAPVAGTSTISAGVDAPPESDKASMIRARIKSDGSYELGFPEAILIVRRNNRNPGNDLRNRFNFAMLDGDNNGYLEPKELNGVLPGAFAAIDRDGNGQVFPQELMGYVDRQAEAAGAHVSLRASDQGHKLFDLFDANLDGALTIRELHSAAAVLATKDANHDGALDADELPRYFELELVRGDNFAREDAPAPRRRGSGDRMRTATGEGPAWFQKMDRNRDGDLSWREFLGTRELFQRIDADHDELITAQEAAAAK